MSDDRIIRIEDKIDKIDGHLCEMKVTMAQQHEVLKEHIRRTEAVEAIVIPIAKRDAMLLGAWKVIWKSAALISIMAAVVEAGLKIIEFLRSP